MAFSPLPATDLLRQLLRYEPETGRLFWRERSPVHFEKGEGRSAEHRCALWNAKWANAEAFSQQTPCGYLRGTLLGRSFLAHRVIWAMEFGSAPSETIDHKNGNRSDNRLCNLKQLPMRQNARNLSVRKDTKSGVAGVSFDSRHRSKPWRAAIKVDGASIYLGRFASVEEAATARRAAEKLHGFAPETGKPSGHYWRR